MRRYRAHGRAPARPCCARRPPACGLSARAYHRVLKLARTIADLAGEDVAGAQHVAEALQYRPRSAVE